MGRKYRFLLLALCLLWAVSAVFGGCSSTKTSENLKTASSAQPLPEVAGKETGQRENAAVLFFRYRDEPFLAAENRVINVSPDEPYEMALLKELLAGPEIHSTDLAGVFPQGVQILSTTAQNRTLFVTLSADILEKYADEPVLWENDEKWADEVPLRRKLCMQSIAATVTENCSIDRVQILVEQPQAPENSMRLKESYFKLTEDDSRISSPLTRDDSLILSPRAAMNRIIQLWSLRDWQELFQYVSTGEMTSANASSYFAGFVKTMENLPKILEYDCGQCFVNMENGNATIAVTADILLPDGSREKIENAVIHLRCENNIWKISQRELTGWMEGRTQ